jgi:mannose-6-phosphate isomerase-like protein (cupin superfamily)
MDTTELTAAFFAPDTDGEATWFLNSRMVIKAAAEATGGAYSLLESWIPAGFSPPLHVHHREEEAFLVVEGRVRFRCGDEETEGGPGTFVFLPRDVPHTFVVEGEEPAHMLTLLTPGGGEGFFVDAGRTPEGPGLPPPGPPDIEQLKIVAERYGADVVGPPLTPKEG